MSYILKLVARLSESDVLSRTAEQLNDEAGLMVWTGAPTERRTRHEPLCEVHFATFTSDVARRDINERMGRWLTRPELKEPLARAITALAKATSTPIWLEATWQPADLQKTSRVPLAQLLAHLRDDTLKLDTRYEIITDVATG